MFHVDWFWLFILGISVAGVVSTIMRTNAREKTIRAAIEKGVPLDPATLDALRSRSVDPPGNPRFGLTVASIMTFFVGIGLGVMGYFINFEDHQVIWPLIGIGGLLWCISAGLFVASRFAPAPPTH
jgi:hypothetical protein